MIAAVPWPTRHPALYLPRMATRFRSTLWRVLVIQAIALAMLWLLQSRYTP